MPKFEVRFTCEVRKIKTMIVEAESEGMLNSNFPLLSEEAYRIVACWPAVRPNRSLSDGGGTVMNKPFAVIGMLMATSCAQIVGTPDDASIAIVDEQAVYFNPEAGSTVRSDAATAVDVEASLPVSSGRWSTCSSLQPAVPDTDFFSCSDYCGVFLGSTCSVSCGAGVDVNGGNPVAGMFWCLSPGGQCAGSLPYYLTTCDVPISCVDTGRYTTNPSATCCCQ